MKTTIDLPDLVFRKAKATAAENGISLKTFITEAVESRLATSERTHHLKPWMALLNELPVIPKEVLESVTRRVAEADAEDIARQIKGDHDS